MAALVEPPAINVAARRKVSYILFNMSDSTGKPEQGKTPPLRGAMRSARIEAAERSAVIVELRDAEAARLEMLSEALDPVFAEIPAEHLQLFDRGLAAGMQPRLWIDMVTHVSMGRDKRTYRFLQDTVNGRRVLAESLEIAPVVEAITRYVARRLIAREQMLAETEPAHAIATVAAAEPAASSWLRGKNSDTWFMLLVGIGIGVLISLIVASLR
jgi:hypothetical protein